MLSYSISLLRHYFFWIHLFKLNNIYINNLSLAYWYSLKYLDSGSFLNRYKTYFITVSPLASTIFSHSFNSQFWLFTHHISRPTINCIIWSFRYWYALSPALITYFYRFNSFSSSLIKGIKFFFNFFSILYFLIRNSIQIFESVETLKRQLLSLY